MLGGAAGVISVASNVVPGTFSRLCRLASAGDAAAARALEAPLDDADRQIPLLRPDAFDKNTLKAMQEAVVSVAQAHGLPEGLLCARRHLEALLEGRGWPDALAGWRRELLEPALAPFLPHG